MSCRSVKLLDECEEDDGGVTRDSWWQEIRQEVRGHARCLGCNVIVGYTEDTAISDDCVVLCASGTAASAELSQVSSFKCVKCQMCRTRRIGKQTCNILKPLRCSTSSPTGPSSGRRSSPRIISYSRALQVASRYSQISNARPAAAARTAASFTCLTLITGTAERFGSKQGVSILNRHIRA